MVNLEASGIGDGRNFVMLELARRATNDDLSEDLETNRIGLLAESISISTNKQSVALPVPFSGLVRGESTTLNMDMGMSSKTITVDGIIIEQEIRKDNSTGATNLVKMTPFEIAQLLHSYIDSSALHEDQSISKLIILYPSRVDGNFNSRGLDDKEENELPLISFNWGNREYDVPNWTQLETPFASVANSAKNIEGVTGFIDSFTTTHVGTEYPAITFNLTFTQASTILSDFINQTV
jgi:hypothetical protein|tara:strand:+ start:16520 stop:17230 length:711 start_codon:yes stop_codon:yes gene_type:complete